MTVERRTVEHDGMSTHYLEAGDVMGAARETVLLVHDGWFGADAETLWEKVVPQLAADYHVLAPDMVGFGRTDKLVWFDRSMYQYRAHHLGSFVRAVLGPEARVHGVGTSMGGSILLRDAVAENPMIPLASVMTISGSGGPWRSEFGAAELGAYDGTEEDQRRMLEHLAAGLPDAESFVRRRHTSAMRPGHAASMLVGRVKSPFPAPERPADPWPAQLADVHVPVTVVGCTDDPLMERGWETHFTGLSPHVTTVTLQARHAPSLDQPERVAALVQEQVARAAVVAR